MSKRKIVIESDSDSDSDDNFDEVRWLDSVSFLNVDSYFNHLTQSTMHLFRWPLFVSLNIVVFFWC